MRKLRLLAGLVLFTACTSTPQGEPPKPAAPPPPSTSAGPVMRVHFIDVGQGDKAKACSHAEPYEGRTSTTIQVADRSLTITHADLLEICEAFRVKAKDHPDKEHLEPLIDHAGIFITDDGVAHIGVFVLTAEAPDLILEFVPGPQHDRHDTFGFAAVVDRVNGAWVVQRVDHAHYRWR